MNKSDLVRIVSVKMDVSVQHAEKAVDDFFDSMIEGLGENKRVEIRGFGSFHVRDYDGYKGRNPRTGETVAVQPKKLPFFKPGKDLRDAVNASTK